MIFVCSRGRRKTVETFFSVSQPMLCGRVLIDDDDPSYEGMSLPANWSFLSGKRAPVTRILNRAYEAMPKEPFYAVICDDMVYLSDDWDLKLSEAAGSRYVAWGDDGRWGKKLCTSFFIGGDLIRKMGWLVHPAVGHLYGDTIWWMIASAAGIGRYLPEVQFRHHKIVDRTFKERRIANDAETFARLRFDIPELTKRAAL